MKNKHGFGLIEFLLVIAFVALFVGLLLPLFNHPTYKAIKDNPFITTNVVLVINQKLGWVQFVDSNGVTNELPRAEFCKIYTENH